MKTKEELKKTHENFIKEIKRIAIELNKILVEE